ncbi:MAG: class II aldolase/adducin family protein [Atopobiaceae bacterium]
MYQQNNPEAHSAGNRAPVHAPSAGNRAPAQAPSVGNGAPAQTPGSHGNGTPAQTPGARAQACTPVDEARELICQIGKLLYDRGYVASNDGNISVRVAPDRLLITPSGVSKGRMTPDMLVLCDRQGNVAPEDTSGRHPSSEIKMHLRVFDRRPDVGAVVHAHPVYATAFAICRHELSEAYLPELVLNFGKIPVAPFAMLSTEEVPRSIEPYLDDYNGLLLANHGALAWGANLWAAFDLMETIEHSAKIYHAVHQLGGGVQLDEDQVNYLTSLRAYYRKRAEVQKPGNER